MKKMLSYVVSAVSLLVGVTAVSVPIVCADTNKENTVAFEDSSMSERYDAMTKEVECGVNANGQTYGILDEYEHSPDLIAVVGDNGKAGYVYISEFFSPRASCPEEAVAQQKARDKAIADGTYVSRSINVYESDGETIIDTFTESITIAIMAENEAQMYSAMQEVKNGNANKERIVMYSDADMTQEVEHNYPDYSVNANGQTYGIGGEANYVEDFPDLIAVRGDNGKSGYVYTSEFFKSPVSCPEEAVAYQKAVDNGEYTPKVLNVYESDGETIIDTFTETVSTKEDIEMFHQLQKD